MSLKRIRLELARCADFPEGSHECGYDFVAPLTESGELDAAAWRQVPGQCTVRRFWRHQDDEAGRLVHTGAHGWSFRYSDRDPDDEEPIFQLDRHRMVEGEYVSITEHDGVLRTFRVVRVR